MSYRDILIKAIVKGSLSKNDLRTGRAFYYLHGYSDTISLSEAVNAIEEALDAIEYVDNGMEVIL